MNPLDILPPAVCVVFGGEILPQAELADVLEHNVSPLDIRITRLNGAVATATEAVLVQVGRVAVRALPEHVARSELQQRTKVRLNTREVLQEVNRAIRRRSEPEVKIDDVVLGHHKLAHDYHLLTLVIRRLLVPVDQLVAIVRANEHRWDPDATPSAIVAHQNLIDHFRAIIDNDSHSDAQILHIAHFLHETALATACDHKGADIIGAFEFVLDLVELFAGELVRVGVVQLAHDGLPVRHVTKVGVVRPNGRIYVVETDSQRENQTGVSFVTQMSPDDYLLWNC